MLSFLSLYGALRELHSFPTRRSSDLPSSVWSRSSSSCCTARSKSRPTEVRLTRRVVRSSRRTPSASSRDRKSTRLNSSHSSISYAVFCLKKKNELIKLHPPHHPYPRP